MRTWKTSKSYILERVVYDPKTKCWLWTGHCNNANYPVGLGGELVHRAAYELWVGPIPEGHDLDHTCPRKQLGDRYTGNVCVNPHHLNPVTRSHHVWLTYIRRRGQMPFKQLRVARHLHNEVGRQ